jgi:hypothetical protein
VSEPQIVESYDLIDPWLFGVLSNDSFITSKVGNRISSSLSGAGIKTPYITWEVSATRAVRGISGVLLDTNSLVDITAVTSEAAWKDAALIAGRIRTLIDRKNVTISTPIPASLACFLENEIRYPDVTEGVQYRHLGGAYRVLAVAL